MIKSRLILITLLFMVFCVGKSQTQTYADMGDSVKTWLALRVENAAKGIKEKVEMPFVVRSTGWGCMCPDSYVGVSPGMGDGPWIWPIKPRPNAAGGQAKKFPEVDSVGHSLIVQGYFTGKWFEQDLRNEDGEPAEWLYKMPEFKITAWRKNEKEYDVLAPYVIK